MEKVKTDNSDFLAMVERMIKAAARRCGSADESDLAALHDLKRSVDVALKHAIQAKLASGRSWQHIGSALGLSRQGAQQRYGK